MINKDKFYKSFEYMRKFGFDYSKQFLKDISKLVTSNVEAFLESCRKDFSINKLNNYNKFEKLNLSLNQAKRLKGLSLYRYEYRKESNIRIIYTIIVNNTVYAVCAFNEDSSKRKSKDSYNANINRAINIIMGGKDDEDE